MHQTLRNSRAASMPIDFSTCMTPDSSLGRVNCIATHASHAADDLVNASRKHDVQFLHDVNRKMNLSGRPPMAAPVLRRPISVPAQQYHSKRSTWVAPSTTRHTDDYEVAAFLSGAPLRPYTPLRSASLAPANYSGRQAISAYSTGHRPSYRWDDNDSDDVVVGVARTARHGDIQIGIPSAKRHVFESQYSVDNNPPHIPFVETRVVAPLRSQYVPQYNAPITRITRHSSMSLPAPSYHAYSSDYAPGYHAGDFGDHASAFTPAPLMAQLASYRPYEHHRSISLPVQISSPSYHAYTSDYSPQYQAHAADFSNHASAYTPAPLMAQLASYPAYEVPYPVQHQYPIHQHHQINNAYVPPCEYHYSGAYTSPINKKTSSYSYDFDDEIAAPTRVNYSSTLPRTKTSYGGSSGGDFSPSYGGGGASSGGGGGRSLSKYGQDKGSALDKYMPKTSSKRSDSLPYIPPVMNYKNVKAPMSDTRKKCRDLLCKTKNDPHYFD